MAHALHGNVYETAHEIHKEVGKLIGDDAAKTSMMRILRLSELQQTIDAVREISGGMSADQYLKVMNRIGHKIRETEQ